MKKKNEPNSTDNPLYHNTWTLLKKYRDVVWSLELSVQQVRNTFEIEYGNTVEEFLDSIYLAGADLTGSAIERHARCIEQSHTTPFYLPSSFATWTKSLKSCDRMSVISVSGPITGAAGKLSTH